MLHLSAFRKIPWIILLLALANGCSSYPQACYYKVTDGIFADKEGLIPFALQGALVTIAPEPDPKQKQKDTMKQPGVQLGALGLIKGQKKSVEDIEGLRERRYLQLRWMPRIHYIYWSQKTRFLFSPTYL